jgi:hypothetical protein
MNLDRKHAEQLGSSRTTSKKVKINEQPKKQITSTLALQLVFFVNLNNGGLDESVNEYETTFETQTPTKNRPKYIFPDKKKHS